MRFGSTNTPNQWKVFFMFNFSFFFSRPFFLAFFLYRNTNGSSRAVQCHVPTWKDDNLITARKNSSAIAKAKAFEKRISFISLKNIILFYF